MKQRLLKKTTLLLAFIGMLTMQLSAQADLIYDFNGATFEGWTSQSGTGAFVSTFENNPNGELDITWTPGGNTKNIVMYSPVASRPINSGLKFVQIRISNTSSQIERFRLRGRDTAVNMNSWFNAINAEPIITNASGEFSIYNFEITNTDWASVTDIDNWQILFRNSSNAHVISDNGEIEIDYIKLSASCFLSDVSDLAVIEASPTQLDLSWTDSSCFDEVLIVANETSGVTSMPSGDGTAYTANATFGTTGTDSGLDSGEYAVFKGTGNTVSVTGLTTDTQYHFTVFTRQGMSWSSGVIGNGTPTAPVAIPFEDYAGAEEADGTTTGVIEPSANGNNSVTGWFFQDLDFSFSDTEQATGDYSIKFDSDDAATATPYNAFLGSPSAAAGSHVVVFGQQEVNLKVFIVSNPPSQFRTSIIRNNATPMDGGVSQENINWDLSGIAASDYNTWVTLKQIVTFPDSNIDPLQDFADARLQIRIDEANLTPAVQCVMFFDDIKFTPTITTAQTGNWEDTTTWVGSVVPTATSPAVIAHTVSVNSDVECSSMLINNTPTTLVSINAGNSLTINGDVTTSNDIYLLSNSNLFSSLIVKGTINGRIVYQRFVGSEANRDLISVPVTGLTFGNFSTAGANSQLFENPANPTQKLFGPFNNNNGFYEIYDEVSDAGVTLVSGKGYRAATNSGSNLRFNSNATTSDVSIAITDETATGTGNYKRWNLIGNPYPSYLDFGAFFTENSSEFDTGAFQAIYGHNGAGTTIWNNLNTSEKIAPGQGFFVRAKVTGGTVNFKPAMQTIGNSDDFLVGRSLTPNNVLSEFFITTESATSKTKIYFVDNQTRGLDPGYDAAAFGGDSSKIFTHLVEENTGIDVAIQALPYEDFNDVAVPLGIKTEEGIQATIGLDMTATNIPTNINIYLEDNVANTWTLLNNSDYIFTPPVALNGTGRFYLHYSNTTLSIKDDAFTRLNISTDQTTKQIIIDGQLNVDTVATIYDIQGRTILSKSLNTNRPTNTIDANNLSTGIYIVKVQNISGSKSQKIILR